MAFVVTYNTVLPDNTPTFEVWVDSILDPDVVYAKYPELAGVRLIDHIENQIATFMNNVSTGFVDVNTNTDLGNSTHTVTETYESQDDYNLAIQNTRWLNYGSQKGRGNITFNSNSKTVTGVNTFFTQDLNIGEGIRALTKLEEVSFTIGTISSIESDTSLTLENNATMSATDSKFEIELKKSAFAFIMDLYEETYNIKQEKTLSNV